MPSLKTLMLFGALAVTGFGASRDLQAGVEAPIYVLAVANSESFDPDLPVLKYPADDLRRFVHVMTRTGEVPGDHVFEVVDGTKAKFREVMSTIASRVKTMSKNSRSKFVFYFTGHSDATGLHLADGLLPKDELHALIASIPAETRIALLDSCYSGALASKGIRPAPGFVVPQAEFDEPSGSVFLAATSASDVAFEIEELKGSLFTHYLVDGLYGSADGNQDGLVTIDELYQYVYKRMSADTTTLPTQQAQKPEYRVDLHGRGALILSYLQQTTSAVTLAADVLGELTLVSDNGLQIFRMTKSSPAPINLKLVPGDYSVTLKQKDQLGQAPLKVRSQGATTLAIKDFAMAHHDDLAAVAKGARPHSRWGMAVGINTSSYAVVGPHVEMQVATRSARIESSDWRLIAFAGGHQNRLAYQRQTGKAESLSLLLGVQGSTLSSLGVEGEQWQLLVGGGADYMWAHWDGNDAEKARTFDPLIPKIAVGIGTSFIASNGRAIGVAFRREWPFAKDENGDVLAFGSNVVTMSVEW